MRAKRLASWSLIRLGATKAKPFPNLPEHAPFDAVVVTAAAVVLPAALQDQVFDGGRIVIFVGPPGNQRMFCFQRQGEHWEAEYLGRFGFVPLVRD